MDQGLGLTCFFIDIRINSAHALTTRHVLFRCSTFDDRALVCVFNRQYFNRARSRKLSNNYMHYEADGSANVCTVPMNLTWCHSDL
jgi:hypothetical protein